MGVAIMYDFCFTRAPEQKLRQERDTNEWAFALSSNPRQRTTTQLASPK
jgi:hypothetical protein